MRVLDDIVTLKCRIEAGSGIRLNAFVAADDIGGIIEKFGGVCMNPKHLELGKPRCYYLPPGAVTFEMGTIKSYVTFYGPDLSTVSAMKERVKEATDYRLIDAEIAGDLSHGR